MAIEPDPAAVQEVVDRVTGDVDGVPLAPVVETQEEIYRLDPKTKIPVSKKEGALWKSRKDAGIAIMRDLVEGWDEAEKYYDNAQQNHRQETQGNKQGNRAYGKNRRDSYSMTENIVYATVNAVIPNTYAKNPTVEITMLDPQMEKHGVMLEHLLNRLADMKAAPGINLKPKLKKGIVRCELDNEAWFMVSWVKREDSAEQALEDIKRIGAELAKPDTDQKKIKELEGELQALEEVVDLLDPPGPKVTSVHGRQVIVDPDSCEDDHSDARWKMVSFMFSTSYLNARFRVKNAEGQYGSAYEPTHIVDATSADKDSVETVQQQIDTFKIFDVNNTDYGQYGYNDKISYERAQRTKVWFVFDKTKRRYYMYSDKDWTWPIWVFDDPYHFPNFFPLVKLQYHSSPVATRTRGEVSHYLDQQDEINVIVDELNRARVSLRDGTIYNSAVLTPKDVEDIMLNANKKIKGVKLPDGTKLQDHIMGPPMPTLEYEHLWDKSQAKQAVTMISGLGEAMRGEQYKTNTTNQAIEQYNSISGMRLDEKRDATEDCVGEIMYLVMFLCLQFMDSKTMASIVGPEYAPLAQQMSAMTPEAIRSTVLCNIEGGSTQKPTSAAKKAEALQIGQILGQFASASPVILLFVLKTFQRSFDGLVFTDQDWTMLIQSIMQSIQQQSAEQGAEDEGGDDGGAQAAVDALVQRGVPREEAVARVKQRVQQRTTQQ